MASAAWRDIPGKSKPKTRPQTSKRHAAAKRAGRTGPAKVVLLAGGNPQIAMGDGDVPVQAFIKAAPGWKGEIARRLDASIARNVPGVRKAVKWNSPFYGIEGQGWFLSFHCYANFVRVAFFRGTSLRPLPLGESKVKGNRYLDVYEEGFDEAQFERWVRQAAAIPGWSPSGAAR